MPSCESSRLKTPVRRATRARARRERLIPLSRRAGRVLLLPLSLDPLDSLLEAREGTDDGPKAFGRKDEAVTVGMRRHGDGRIRFADRIEQRHLSKDRVGAVVRM